MNLRIDRRELLKRGAILVGSLAVAGTAGTIASCTPKSNPNPRPGAPPHVTAVGRGCDPTGVHVCSAQLNSMLAEAAGGTAWVEDGTYLFNEPLILPAGTTLDGHGTLKLADHAMASTRGALVLGNNCTVRGITVDGNKTKQIGDGPTILGQQVSGVQIVGVTIKDAPGQSIYLYQCAGSQINGCHIERGGLTEATNGSRASISTLGSSHVRIANNRITGSAGEGIFLGCGDALVATNDIRDTHSIAIAVGGGQHRNIVISSNYIQINRTWLSTDRLWWPNCIDVADSYDCVVAGNHTERGAAGVANAPPSYRTTVVDNTCNHAMTTGVLMGGAGSFESVDLVISGNSCVGNGQDGISVPYVAGGEVRDNNCLDNGQAGMDPHNAGILIYGDDARGYVNGLVVEGNRCGDLQATRTQLSGVTIVGAHNTNIRVDDNDLRGNGIWSIRDSSVAGSVMYSGNLG